VTSATCAQYSWRDVTDENAALPVREATANELESWIGNTHAWESNTDASEILINVASGAICTLGKALQRISGTSTANNDALSSQARVPVIVFKLLDLVEISNSLCRRQRNRRRRARLRQRAA